MPDFWERQYRRTKNLATQAAPILGGVAGTVSQVPGVKQVTNAVAPVAGVGGLLANSDVRSSVINDPMGTVKGAFDEASGVNATDQALQQQLQGVNQAQGAITDAYNQGRGLLSPYIQGGAQNFQDYTGMVRSGAFTPQFQGYQGPMSTYGANSPQFQSYQGPMSSGIQAPGFQQYQGPMSSGNQLPQYQQFQGPTAYQGMAAPERQMATADSVQSYMNPFLDKIIAQGTNAISHSGAARGLFGSTGNINDIGTFATNAAANAFNDASGRFMQDQSARQGDYQYANNFGMQNFNQNFQNAYGLNQDANAWNANNADRAQSWFEGDRAAGLGYNQYANNFGMNQAQFNQGVFEGDRAAGMANNAANNANALNLANFNQGAMEGDRTAGMGYNQYLNNWNANAANNNASLWQGLVNMGYGAAGQGADMATAYGGNLAGLYGDAANARANATMTRSAQRRGLIQDSINAGTQLLGMG